MLDRLVDSSKQECLNIKDYRETCRASMLYRNTWLTGHSCDWDNIKILNHGPVYIKRLISEMLYIRGQEGGINLQTDTDLLDNIYIPFLNKINSRST